jgi:hypothetical protein
MSVLRGERLLRVSNALVNTSHKSRQLVVDVVNELEDALEIERRRMAFMVYYGRHLNIANGEFWFVFADGKETGKYNSAQKAIDVAMLQVNWC